MVIFNCIRGAITALADRGLSLSLPSFSLSRAQLQSMADIAESLAPVVPEDASTCFLLQVSTHLARIFFFSISQEISPPECETGKRARPCFQDGEYTS